MDKTTGAKMASEIDHIRQSVADILTTPTESRVMRREYGSQLFELIDRPLDAQLALQIAAASVMALKKWEKRIEITQFSLNFDPENPSSITADIEAVYHSQNAKIRLENVNLR
jgi:phage baseplate assembly protein W